MSDYILPWHIMTLEALISGRSDSFGMIPRFIGEAPLAAIAMFSETRSGVEVMPLFVAITQDMDITFPDRDEEASGDSDEGGGPDRD